MTMEEQLRTIILYKFKSIREFANFCGLPNSTVDSVIKRGIIKSGVGTVIKIFDVLNLDMESIPSGQLTQKEAKKSPGPDGSEPRDAIEREFISLLHDLRPAQRALALSLLKTAVAENQGKPDVDQASVAETSPKTERQKSPK